MKLDGFQLVAKLVLRNVSLVGGDANRAIEGGLTVVLRLASIRPEEQSVPLLELVAGSGVVRRMLLAVGGALLWSIL